MKNLYLLLIGTLFSPVCLFAQAQGENDNWVFGNNAGVNFSSGSPVSFSGSAMQTYEGVASISDTNGNLLFYSDGKRVWNKNHQIMPNGFDLTSSGNDAVQGVMIIPYPNHPNEYLIFTTNGGNPTSYNFMAYSKVDMNEGNGLGDIVELNNPLENHNGSTTWVGKVEKITVINNEDLNYWVILAYQDKLLSYYVDGNGVNITPVVSQINQTTSSTSHIRISPNKEMLAITEYGAQKISIYSFDSSNGTVISNPILIINSPYYVYSSEFSNDSNIIWFSISGSIRGYDLDTGQLVSFSFSGGLNGTIQRATDGNLYIAKNLSQHLARINNPNDLNNASLTTQAIYLNGNLSRAGLPQLIPKLESTCPTDLVLSTPESNNNYIYETSNTIITNQNYIVDVNQDITLSAGNAIEMQPNTILKAGSVVLAKIEGCVSSLRNNKDLTFETIEIYINLDGDEEKQLVVYPNPVNDRLNIQANEVVTNVKIYDFSGTLLFQSAPSKISPIIDMINFKPGIYFVEITVGDTTETVKVIK